VIERVVRVANSFREAERMDRDDLATMSLEERISMVERLRRDRFGEGRAESGLDRVLVSADRPTSEVRARGGGHAVAGHGEPRLTEDFDVFVEPDGGEL
jgi:hypothetical protein